MYARKGFTLVEILIVVVILGILAAIVIPQFTNASESARASQLAAQMQSIRSQLELYQVQHNGAYPDLVTNWNQMTQYSNAAGDVVAVRDATHQLGPYLQQPPLNAFGVGALAGTSTVAADTSGAYRYAQATGQFVAVIDSAKQQYATQSGMKVNFDYVLGN